MAAKLLARAILVAMLHGVAAVASAQSMLQSELPSAFDSNSNSSLQSTLQSDRLWLASTRHLSSDACNIDLTSPLLRWKTLDHCGNQFDSSQDQFVSTRDQGRRTVIYIHGNRMDSDDALERGLAVYRGVQRFRNDHPIDWVIFSWPSEQIGILANDVRIKADRTDAQGLYLAWLLRNVLSANRVDLIGYSFGGRIATGALHGLAGGSLGGRSLHGDPIVGMDIDAGLVAPAIGSNWLAAGGYHQLATQNLKSMTLYYNHRDAVLKRFWLIDEVRGQVALGFIGPKTFAPRLDGSSLPVVSKDCAPVVGLRHSELDYYQPSCRAGAGMANLIDDDVISAF